MPTCLPAATEWPYENAVAPNAICCSPKESVTLKMRLVTASGSPVAAIGPAGVCADYRYLRADGKDGNDELLKRWAAMMECEVTARLEDAAPCREDKLQVRGVAQRRRRDTDAAGRCRTPASDPAAPVQLDRVTSRRVGPHRLVAVGRKEQVAVVCADDRVLDARRRELPDRAGEVVDDRVHDLSSLEREAGLARVVDLLRADDNDLRAVKLLGELRGLQAQKLVKRHVDQLRHPGSGELLAAREVGKERVVDPCAKLAVLFDDREAAGGAGLQRRHADGRDAG